MQGYAPLIDRIELLAHTANRAHTVNRAFGSQLSPFDIARQFADEDIDLLILWMEHTPHAGS